MLSFEFVVPSFEDKANLEITVKETMEMLSVEENAWVKEENSW